ncbi:hypothetical protein [Streptomyces sp. WAC06614]|uniref:hypothetical protein n=1 Tax=Streptomyces sp. WAC06614 TaxID=2487416 RepID=UPI000F79DC98|nr:hypothetical protein [Streptomyces sp. WAC06614]RSS64090.1 hypothetical protein EF918_30480 [Streptomyces sp. WAC06614]
MDVPNLTWISEGTDLDFVRDRNECPQTVEDLFTAGDDWINLFGRWYELEKKPDQSTLELWLTLVQKYRASDPRSYSDAVQAAGVERLIGDWNLQLELGFFEHCNAIRGWVDKAVAKAREQLAEELAQARNRGQTEAQTVTDEQVKERQQRNMGRQLAKARSKQWEREGSQGLTTAMSELTVARMEAVMTAVTRQVKPKFAELYGHYRQMPEKLPALELLEAAHAGLNTAESALREACHMERHEPPRSRARREARDEGLLDAWVEYTTACTELGAAMFEAAKNIVRWATEDAEKKIKENLSSENPRVAAALVGIRITLATLTAAAQCLSLAGGAPAVLATTAAMNTTYELLERLIVGLTARGQARDPEKILELAGREYKPDPAAKRSSTLADTTSEVLKPISGVAVPALHWDTAATGSAMAAKSAPVVGQLVQIGKIAVDLQKLVNPAILEDTRDREALVTLLKRAFAGMSEAAPEGKVDLFAFDPATGTATVMVNGVSGTLRDGRFSPDDRSGGLVAALADWTRHTQDPFPGIAPDGAFTFAGRRLRRFSLQANGASVAAADVVSAITSYEEVAGGYKCRATASAFGLGESVGCDSWQIEFFLTHEGEVELNSKDIHFEWLMRYAQESPGDGIIAQTEKAVVLLERLSEDDPGLSLVTVLRAGGALGEDVAGCILDDEGLWDSARIGRIVPQEALLEVRQAVPWILETRRQLESGTFVPVDWDSLSTTQLFLLRDWYEPWLAFDQVFSAEGEILRWVTFEEKLHSLSDGGADKFNRLVAQQHDWWASFTELTMLRGKIEHSLPADSDEEVVKMQSICRHLNRPYHQL